MTFPEGWLPDDVTDEDAEGYKHYTAWDFESDAFGDDDPDQ
jgi:hypothetical protein